jgi:DNA-binding transcriptional MerR regulator
MDIKKFTASAFADFCGTSRHTLLWYDKFGLLKPDTMGANGYRYYSLHQYIRYDLISIMKQSGSSLAEIRDFLCNKEELATPEFFENKIKILSEQIDKLTAMKQLMYDISVNIEMAGTWRYFEPVLVELEGAAMTAVRLNPEESMSLNEFVIQYARLRKLCTNDPDVHAYPLGAVISREDYLKGTIKELYYFFDTEESGDKPVIRRPAGSTVVICHKGDLRNIGSTIDIAFRFIAQKGLRAYSEIYKYDMLTYLSDSGEEYAFRLLIPVEAAAESQITRQVEELS